MTFEEAEQFALQQHGKGDSFEEITRALSTAGFVSQTTGLPLILQAVRWMINSHTPEGIALQRQGREHLHLVPPIPAE